MPVYCLKCKTCGTPAEFVGSFDELVEFEAFNYCPECGDHFKRDFASENVKNTFQPSRSLGSWFNGSKPTSQE